MLLHDPFSPQVHTALAPCCHPWVLRTQDTVFTIDRGEVIGSTVQPYSLGAEAEAVVNLLGHEAMSSI